MLRLNIFERDLIQTLLSNIHNVNKASIFPVDKSHSHFAEPVSGSKTKVIYMT